MQFKFLKHDLYRYFYPNDSVHRCSWTQKIKTVLTTQAIWALITYRSSRWLLCECRPRLLRVMLAPPMRLLRLWVEMTTGISIDDRIDIGPGLYIGHFGNIFLSGETHIGKLCNISHENTVGYAGRGDRWGVPEIGDFVYIGPGAKVFGKIRIGNHVAIGANAVVTRDLPDHAVAVGLPARVISTRGSQDFVLFNHAYHQEIL